MNGEPHLRDAERADVPLILRFIKELADYEGMLDEVLGLADQNIVSADEIHKLLAAREESMSLILTGTVLPESLKKEADVITHLDAG